MCRTFSADLCTEYFLSVWREADGLDRKQLRSLYKKQDGSVLPDKVNHRHGDYESPSTRKAVLGRCSGASFSILFNHRNRGVKIRLHQAEAIAYDPACNFSLTAT